jgi:hypothetical protein
MRRHGEVKTRSRTLSSALCVLFVAAGCSRSTGTVSGKVTFKGEPLSVGMVTFVPQEGPTQTCSIEPDGRYTLRKVPVGLCNISVVDGQLSRGLWNLQEKKRVDDNPASKTSPRGLRIPPRYSDPSQSGLTYVVQVGDNSYDIDLNP